jgi:hypothetical protein
LLAARAASSAVLNASWVLTVQRFGSIAMALPTESGGGDG